MKQDIKKRVMIAKIVERPLDYMTILLEADNNEVATVWRVEHEELEEIRELFYAYRDEILKLTIL